MDAKLSHNIFSTLSCKSKTKTIQTSKSQSRHSTYDYTITPRLNTALIFGYSKLFLLEDSQLETSLHSFDFTRNFASIHAD